MRLFFGAPLYGLERTALHLERAVTSRSLPLVMLFVGSPGVGKTHLALQLTSHLLSHPRGQLSQHPDLSVLQRTFQKQTKERKTQIGVEEVRLLKHRLQLAPVAAPQHVVWIPEAHLLSTTAANALLKTLEEPPAPTVFLLRAPAVASVLETIRSRSQIFFCTRAQDSEMNALFEREGVEEQQRERLRMYARGSPGRALRLIHSAAARERLMGSEEDLHGLLTAPLYERLRLIAEKLPKTPKERRVYVKQLLDTWEPMLISTLESDVLADERRACAQKLRAAQVARSSLKASLNPQLVLESLFLS